MKALYISNKNDSGKSYASLIISGKKTIEVRKHNTSVRGKIGIVDGNASLLGTVTLHQVKGPFTAKELSKMKGHCSTPKRVLRYSKCKRCLYVWHLKNAKKLKPIKITLKFKNQWDWIDT
jgi:hypothetical protein